ncbi:hypothetical protein V6N13_128482 [Hibiscus sabdariffa]
MFVQLPVNINLKPRQRRFGTVIQQSFRVLEQQHRQVRVGEMELVDLRDCHLWDINESFPEQFPVDQYSFAFANFPASVSSREDRVMFLMGFPRLATQTRI